MKEVVIQDLTEANGTVEKSAVSGVFRQTCIYQPSLLCGNIEALT
jgi:hypothetical protein